MVVQRDQAKGRNSGPLLIPEATSIDMDDPDNFYSKLSESQQDG